MSGILISILSESTPHYLSYIHICMVKNRILLTKHAGLYVGKNWQMSEDQRGILTQIEGTNPRFCNLKLAYTNCNSI